MTSSLRTEKQRQTSQILRSSDPQIVILDLLGSAVLLLALKEYVYNLNVASHVSNQNCSDSLPILSLTPIFGSLKLTNYYCFTQYGTEKEGSVSDSEYKVTQFCLSFSSREHERNSSLHPGSPGYCKYGL